ncbi:DinB family protein [Niabella ginsengisoli]|uniref:DinB family protein n=1 Tax=Niabella ginsengisoli TaxID=522298 RepID=A0ABS9SH76_9BACT|nr:DinB family protein [Niabella ginsengisoli]MCH5597716.1 DinB family protein [Niabella ginsengisoli]
MQPQPTDYPSFYQPYVEQVKEANTKTMLSKSLIELTTFLQSIPESKADFAYDEGKWTVKEVLQHCIDTERIFAYRALCHARGEQQHLPGFEQNAYADLAKVANRSLASLIEETILVRRTTVMLFQSFTEEDLLRIGFVGENLIKTFCWAYIVAGHFMHHQNILINKYNINQD